MDSSIPSGPGVRPDFVSVEATPRPTACAVRTPFSKVLAGGARAFVRGATVGARAIPGSPLMAVAVRNGPVTTTMPLASTTLPEGPGATAGYPVSLGPNVASGGVGAAVGFGAGNPGALSAGVGVNPASGPARTFSALSNVMEVEHNTAKTAIGNIH
jgi:hypothetical protein